MEVFGTEILQNFQAFWEKLKPNLNLRILIFELKNVVLLKMGCRKLDLLSTGVSMFMKILNFCVFNKMVSDRKILWFPSKWGVNHLKRWRNGEVVGKKRIMNYSQKLWPGTANWLVYYSMCRGPFFHHKGAFNKNALLFLEIWPHLGVFVNRTRRVIFRVAHTYIYPFQC